MPLARLTLANLIVGAAGLLVAPGVHALADSTLRSMRAPQVLQQRPARGGDDGGVVVTLDPWDKRRDTIRT